MPTEMPSTEYCHKCPDTCQTNGTMNSIIYFIAFVMILMIFIIGGLIILLLRVRRQGNNIFSKSNPRNDPTSNDLGSRGLITQKSPETTILELRNGSECRKSLHGNDSDLTNNIGNKTNRDTSKSNISKLANNTPINKMLGSNPVHNMILKEQMKRICEAALAKSKITGVAVSLKDLTDLLEQNEANIIEDVNSAIANASHPELEIYEHNPSNIPVTEDIYDSVTASNEDLSTDVITEPAYINARYIKRKINK